METWLVFHREVDLTDFAAFPLVVDPSGRELLTEYFGDHVRVAQQAGTGMVLETPTWRANGDSGAGLGYDAAALDRVNRDAVAIVRGVGDRFDGVEVVVSGCLGPRGDGYRPEELLEPGAAASYHRPQIELSVGAGADQCRCSRPLIRGRPSGWSKRPLLLAHRLWWLSRSRPTVAFRVASLSIRPSMRSMPRPPSRMSPWNAVGMQVVSPAP